MNVELSPPAPLPRREENRALLHMLSETSRDPRESLIFMQAEFNVDIGSRPGLDFPSWAVTDDPDSIRATTLSARQYEAIRSFEEVVKVLCNHGALVPGQLGLWLMDVKSELEYRTPLDAMFMSFTEEKGFDKEVLKKVVGCAAPFLDPSDGGDEAVWGLWRD